MNYTYILQCSDNTLYTGWTNNLKKRLQAHSRKTGAKYTRSRTPVRLVYFEEHDTKQEAMRREYAIKHLSRSEKLKLIESFDPTRLEEFYTLPAYSSRISSSSVYAAISPYSEDSP